ncbi:MAG: hypothetical protein A3B38_03120 [Candidatus Levybacteria bacterium RIFCSPLOWO2_01_FULL_36_13]|nr:MAG: hypothetical protein A2684_01645 [Candidatus Levybacteria bacterium RIFCSPHIGHO2_01_FULL_36_15b]OGH35807.1 MAG: hypothetical protein A3B38_03120 [Candidatus Levybacteria bacterium RIFCSPLOWO2_01_FULL_36_13]
MKEFNLRADEVADLDPYNVRGLKTQDQAKELLTPESNSQIDRFTNQQKDKLQELEYRIFTLHGETLGSLVEKGAKISWAWDDSKIDFNRSYSSEVAIANKHFAGFSRYDEQVRELIKFERKIRESLSEDGEEIKAVIGRAQDYAELFYQDPEIFNATGGDFDIQIRTSTEPNESYRAYFFMREDELIFDIESEIHSGNSAITPLIIPRVF